MKSLKENGILKTIVASATAICLCSGLFLGANNAMVAFAMEKTEEIPTAYNIAPVVFETESENYVKPDYKVVEQETPASKTAKGQASFANALSRDEAAERGAMFIWELYRADLDGKTIQMYYFVDHERLRAYWAGDVYESEADIYKPGDDPATFAFTSPSFGFIIDAVTGEKTSIFKTYSSVEGKETTPFDPEKTKELWKDNCSEHLQLAAAVGEKHLGTKIVSTEFKDVSAYGVINGRPIGENTKTSVQGTDSGIEVDKHFDPNRGMEAECIMIVALVTDEYGRQCEVTITTDTKEIMVVNTIVPADPNGIKGLG